MSPWRISKIGSVAGERWLELVDGEDTPVFDPIRSQHLADVVTQVCATGRNYPLLTEKEWMPLVKAADMLAGERSLGPAAVTHTAAVDLDR